MNATALTPYHRNNFTIALTHLQETLDYINSALVNVPKWQDAVQFYNPDKADTIVGVARRIKLLQVHFQPVYFTEVDPEDEEEEDEEDEIGDDPAPESDPEDEDMEFEEQDGYVALATAGEELKLALSYMEPFLQQPLFDVSNCVEALTNFYLEGGQQVFNGHWWMAGKLSEYPDKFFELLIGIYRLQKAIKDALA